METQATVIHGINSIPLLNDGSRSGSPPFYWEAESVANPAPEQYLTTP